jgi:hypothetical protein
VGRAVTHIMHIDWCNIAYNQGRNCLDRCCNVTYSLYLFPHNLTQLKRKTDGSTCFHVSQVGTGIAVYRCFWVPVLLVTALIQVFNSECTLCFAVRYVSVITVILGCCFIHTHAHTHTHTLATCFGSKCDLFDVEQ